MSDIEEPIHSACWTEERAIAILRSVALANSEAEFLAVHQPIRDFQLSTTTGHGIAPTDEALLADLLRPETRHAFCVIEGEPGAGKSHLIRWLDVKWTGDDLVMLIERADGSLTGTLRQLRDKLGEKYKRLFANLAHSVEASFEGRVKLFHANLAASLSPGFFTKALGDEGWCGAWDVDRLIGHPTVQDKWDGPARILNVMSGDGGERNSASASFDLADIVSLSRLQLAAEGLPPKALMLIRTLKRECDRIEPALLGDSASELLLSDDLDIPESRRLLSALNARRDFAVQPILGITVDGLRDMFLELRKVLLGEKRRLVLLLEDVTSWEGIDGQLIDSLAVDSRTRTDVCDMISVVGMTPLYLKNIQGNYGGRISHLIRLGRQSETGGFQQTVQLVGPEAQTEFAAAYLRAVRVNKVELDAWHAAGANPATVPNQCTSCQSRERCFAAFGSYEEIGLFPFNRNAITNMFEALEDPKGSQSLQTPRGMIQGVLSPVLLYPDRLDEGGFPPFEIELSEWMPQRKLQPTTFLLQIIEAEESDPERRAQLRRLTMLWGLRSHEVAVHVELSGQLSFYGIAKDIFESFRLPWLGAGLESTTLRLASGQLPVEAQGNDDTVNENAAKPGTIARPQSPTRTATEGRIQGNAPSVSQAKLKTLLEQAQAWRDGKPVGDPTAWEQLLFDLLNDVRETLLDPVPGLWEKLFTKETVKLEGLGKSDVRHFVIPREPWATRGIEGFITLRQGLALEPLQRESDRRAVARLLIRLAELANAHIKRRLLLQTEAWSIAGSIAQVLLARAWLRGVVRPSDPLVKQFQNVLSTEQEARSMPTERVDSWGELIKATDYWHDKFRDQLRNLILLPLGNGEPLYNAGVIAKPLADLRAKLRTVQVPDKSGFSKGLEEIAKLVELTKQTDGSLRQIPAREATRLSERKARVLTLLRQASLSHQLNVVDTALKGVTAALVQAAPVENQNYFEARRRVSDAFLLDESSEAWLELRAYLLEDDPIFEIETQAAEHLNRVLSIPVASLRLSLDALENAERAIFAAYSHANAYVTAHQSEGDLTVVREFGVKLAKAADSLLARLRAKT